MRRLSFFSLGLFASTAVYAATATLSWVHPTQNTDGSLIPTTGNGAIAQTRIEWGTCSSTGGFGTKESEVVVPYPETSTVINNFLGGETVCFRAYSKNNYGMESAASAVVVKVFDAPKPRPPSLSVVETVAYEVRYRKGTVLLGRAVGTVPIGTPCATGIVVSPNYYFVDSSTISFTRNTRSGGFVAKCALG